MRCLIAFLMLIMSFTSSYSQGKRQLVNDTINQHEAMQLNKLASACRLNFDFTHKKVAFYTGSGGDARRDKSRYFSECAKLKEYYPDAIGPMTKIYIFDKDERARANGYDAVIVYGSVKQVPSKKSYIRRLHRSKFFSKH